MLKYRVYYNTHQYSDGSGTPRSAHRVVKAENEEDARERVRALKTVGKRWIGMVFQAELVIEKATSQVAFFIDSDPPRE